MSQIFTADDLLQIKEVLLEELAIANGEIPPDELTQLLTGFASKRADFSALEEQLIRRIVTNDVNGKLPSESLREKIVLNTFAQNNATPRELMPRNSAGSLKLDFNNSAQSGIILSVKLTSPRYKKSKVKYAFDTNFSEFIVNPDNSAELIEQLKEQIESLKNKLSLLETDKTNYKDILLNLEIDNSTLREEIAALNATASESVLDTIDAEDSRQEELEKIRQEAQNLVLQATEKLTQKESDFAQFKSKVELIFVVSKTYEEIVENFKKIGIGA